MFETLQVKNVCSVSALLQFYIDEISLISVMKGECCSEKSDSCISYRSNTVFSKENLRNKQTNKKIIIIIIS